MKDLDLLYRGVTKRASTAWRWVRSATGDDAYERYLAHLEQVHPNQTPLTRRAFFEESQRQKWSGVSRCC